MVSDEMRFRADSRVQCGQSEADNQIATHVVPNLVLAVEKAPKADASLSNVAKCIGGVVVAQRGVAAGTIAEFAKHLRVSGLQEF